MMAVPELRNTGEGGFTCVARIRHTQGRRGEVAADIETDFPERFAAGARFLLGNRRGTAEQAREYRLEDSWLHKGQVILKFAGVGSISEAEQLIGYEVLIPAAERKPLAEGNYYLDDLVGCAVVEQGREIGRVADWEDTGGGVLLHVEPADKTAAGEEILIPFAQEICTAVDVAGKLIQVRLPEGLMELNAGQPPARQARERRRRAVGSGKK